MQENVIFSLVLVCQLIFVLPILRSRMRKEFGVNFEGRLNFDYHVNTLLKEVSETCHALERVCNYMDKTKRRVLMNTFITS